MQHSDRRFHPPKRIFRILKRKSPCSQRRRRQPCLRQLHRPGCRRCYENSARCPRRMPHEPRCIGEFAPKFGLRAAEAFAGQLIEPRFGRCFTAGGHSLGSMCSRSSPKSTGRVTGRILGRLSWMCCSIEKVRSFSCKSPLLIAWHIIGNGPNPYTFSPSGE